MKQSTRQQTADQSIKGGIAGIVIFLLAKWDTDPALIAMATPLITGFLSWASTKIGDPELASFIGTAGVEDGKPVKVAVKKAPAKAAPAKKAPAKKVAK